MSVLDDIMKKSNPLSNPVTSQSVATQAAPKPAEQVAQGGVNTTAPAVTQMPKTGFNAEALKVAQDLVNNMNSQGVTPAVTTAPVNTPAEQQPQQQKPMSYVDMLNAFYTPETAEQKAKRERKEKWDKTAAAIGDGISALANLYYTTKGAPNSYDGKNSMSERTRQLYDKLDKDRKENDRWYLNHYMNAAKMDEDAKRYADERDYKRGRDKVADERYADERDYKRGRDAISDERYSDERDYKRGRDAVLDARADKQLELQKEKMAEQKRQFYATLNANKGKAEVKASKDDVPLPLGDGSYARISSKNLSNPYLVSYAFNSLPDGVKDEIESNQLMVGKTMQDLTPQQMLATIGKYAKTDPKVRAALKEIGGVLVDKDGNVINMVETKSAQPATKYKTTEDGEIDWNQFVSGNSNKEIDWNQYKTGGQASGKKNDKKTLPDIPALSRTFQ